jgi:hypothetical protein
MLAIENTADLMQAMTEPKTLLFLWVEWAVQARKSNSIVEGLLESWKANHREHSHPAYRVDLSSQSGELWEAIRTWLHSEGQAVDEVTYGGSGALLCVLAGKVALAVPNVSIVEPMKLAKVTEAVFSPAT